MLRWLSNALASSVGRKAVLGLTGLALIGFLIEHLYGNLKLIPAFVSATGTDFEAYREHLHGWGWLLTLGEIGLFALFGCHVFLALKLTLENREARRTRYVVRNDRGAKTFGSASMFATGALILGYLIWHLLDFRFNTEYHAAPAATVAAELSEPGHGVFYVVAALVVGLHLSHGFQSALQSLGANHPRWTPLAQRLGWALSLALAAGFAAIPVYFLFFWSGEAP